MPPDVVFTETDAVVPVVPVLVAALVKQAAKDDVSLPV
jgi:hypothetical protein